jgi:aerobic C4-dicarboxylate transport protein
MPNVLKSLFAQVIVALILGILLGVLYPSFAVELKPLGDGFIKLIVPLIVFCVVVHGIAGAGDLTKVGRVGVKAIVYFECITAIALVLGIVLAYVFQPGVGMNIDPASLDPKVMSGYVDRATQVASGGTVDFLMKIIPATVFAAFTSAALSP